MSLDRWEQFNYIADTADLKTTEKNLLFIIFRFINHKTKYANPSRAVLMEKSGIKSEQTLDKVLNELIKKGFLKRKTTKGFPSQYFIVVPTKNEVPTKIEGGVTTKIEGGVTTKIEGQKENKKKIKENIYSDLIKKYPGKKIKSVRDKKLPKILKEYSIEEIERCINRYAEECKGRDKKFILNESTFWNGRYIDYLDENFEEIKNTIETKEENTGRRGIIYDSIEY